ncbi:MAG: hypothetical protein AAF763_08220 [Pseudomonadota bacterium]
MSDAGEIPFDLASVSAWIDENLAEPKPSGADVHLEGSPPDSRENGDVALEDLMDFCIGLSRGRRSGVPRPIWGALLIQLSWWGEGVPVHAERRLIRVDDALVLSPCEPMRPPSLYLHNDPLDLLMFQLDRCRKMMAVDGWTALTRRTTWEDGDRDEDLVIIGRLAG